MLDAEGMEIYKSFVVVLEIPVEELNLRELELIAFIAFLNHTESCKKIRDLEELLISKFIESSLVVGVDGIKEIDKPESPIIGGGSSHIFVTRKNWVDEDNNQGRMWRRVIKVVHEEIR